MSRLMYDKLPCPECTSTDAYHVYEDEDDKIHGYCFSCELWQGDEATKKYLSEGVDKPRKVCYPITLSNTISNTRVNTTMDTNNSNTKVVPKVYRGISKATLEFFGVYQDESTIVFPYKDAKKHRSLKQKDFWIEGDFANSPMFGSTHFNSGSAKTITITEGELDAMSVFEMMGKFPVISVKSASTAARDCANQHEFINSFDKIVLCFDNDDPGSKAQEKVAKLFNVNKVYFMSLEKYKDANEFLQNGAIKEFQSIWWNARKYTPKGIVSSFSDIAELLKKKDTTTIAEYPFPSLQEMTYGMREGESVLWKAQEKIGKTEILRAIEYHVLKTTDHNIGIIHLEEEEKRSVAGLVGYELKKPAHLPDSGISDSDILETYKQIVKDKERIYLYSHFGSDDPDTILNAIRYLAGCCDCKVIFLDHISMVVSGNKDEGDERRKLDRISTELAQMCRELKFNLQFVSHVNDEGQTRGSRYIAKTADLIISLERNKTSEDPFIRNRTDLTIEGNRFASKSGPAGKLLFDPETFTLTERTKEEIEQLKDNHVPF